MPRKSRKPKSKSAKEQARSSILSDIAKIFVYWDYPEIARMHARAVVQKLVDWGLVDATLPLRIERPAGLTPPVS